MEAKKYIKKENLVRIHNKYIGKVRVYTFIFEDKSKRDLVAVQCCEDPTMYIRLNESEKKIIIMLFTSTGNKERAEAKTNDIRQGDL